MSGVKPKSFIYIICEWQMMVQKFTAIGQVDFEIFNKIKAWLAYGTSGKVHRYLYRISWQSSRQLLRYFGLDQSGGMANQHCHPKSNPTGTAKIKFIMLHQFKKCKNCRLCSKYPPSMLGTKTRTPVFQQSGGSLSRLVATDKLPCWSKFSPGPLWRLEQVEVTGALACTRGTDGWTPWPKPRTSQPNRWWYPHPGTHTSKNETASNGWL